MAPVRSGDVFEIRTMGDVETKVALHSKRAKVDCDSKFTIIQKSPSAGDVNLHDTIELGYSGGQSMHFAGGSPFSQGTPAGGASWANRIEIVPADADVHGGALQYGAPVKLRFVDSGKYMGLDNDSLEVTYVDKDRADSFKFHHVVINEVIVVADSQTDCSWQFWALCVGIFAVVVTIIAVVYNKFKGGSSSSAANFPPPPLPFQPRKLPQGSSAF